MTNLDLGSCLCVLLALVLSPTKVRSRCFKDFDPTNNTCHPIDTTDNLVDNEECCRDFNVAFSNSSDLNSEGYYRCFPCPLQSITKTFPSILVPTTPASFLGENQTVSKLYNEDIDDDSTRDWGIYVGVGCGVAVILTITFGIIAWTASYRKKAKFENKDIILDDFCFLRSTEKHRRNDSDSNKCSFNPVFQCNNSDPNFQSPDGVYENIPNQNTNSSPNKPSSFGVYFGSFLWANSPSIGSNNCDTDGYEIPNPIKTANADNIYEEIT